MQVHQVVIRPHGNLVVILYVDGAGERRTLSFDSTGNAHVASLVEECEQRLPPPEQHPAKAEIQQEISDLEARIVALKQAIGVPA